MFTKMDKRLKYGLVLGVILALIVATGALAKVWTDFEDYSPGSVVSIHGDNSDDAGYLPGEEVFVEVWGPNDYYQTCTATANDEGAWSCDINLWENELAIGTYNYTATGESSNVSQNGTFTDGNATFSGIISEFGTNSPISGATVECISGCNSAATTTSDALGAYELHLQFTGNSGTIKLKASKTGYASMETGNISVLNNDDRTQNFTLTPTDTSSPVITYVLSPASPDGLNGWYKSNVTLTWSVSEPESPGSLVKTGCIDQNITADQAATTFSCSATSTGGSATQVDVTIKRDATAPLVTLVDGPANEVNYTYGSVPAAPTCNASDATSGLDGSCSVSGYSNEVGNHTVTASATDNAGNSNTASRSYTVTKADATCSISGYSGVYDGLAHGATGTCTGVGGETLAGLDLGASFTDVPGGTANWNFTDVTGNYNDDSSSVEIEITKADATIDVNGYTGVYDGAAHGATGSAIGVLGEALAGLDLGASFTDVPGGTAYWNFTDVTGNYNNDSSSVEIVITKADPTCSISGYNGTYDGLAHGATGECTGVLGEELDGLDLGDSFTNVPGGTADWTFTDVTGNYNDASGSVVIDITKANATLVVDGYIGVYDGAAHGATGSATGVLGEALTGLDLGASFTYVPGGTSNWTFTDETGNYNDTSGSVEIVINKADATIVVTGYDVTYDGNAHTATGTATGVNGESLSGLDLSGTTHTNAGEYNDAWTFTDVTGNYNDDNGTVLDKITKADATISVDGYEGFYDGASHGATGTATGVLGEDLSASLDLGASFTDYPGGTAHWTFTDVTGNYNNASGSVAIVIKKADATIVVDGYTGVYDGDTHGATGSAKGVLEEDLSAGLNLGASFTNVPGGTANWTFNGGTNYNNAIGSVEIEITKADATIDVNGYTGVYDGVSHGATGTATGVKGEDLSASLDLGASFTDYPGGTANWTFSGGTNYKDAAGSVAIVITKADAMIVVNGYTGVYDGNPHGATGTATGVGGVDLSAGLNLGDSFTDVPGGTANWTFSGGINYKDATGSVAIVITEADATIVVTGYTGVYDGDPHGATGSATGVKGEALAGLDLGSSFTNVPGGTADWTFTGGTNYNDASGSVEIVINPKAASVTPNTASKKYGEPDPVLTGSLSGFLATDGVMATYSRTPGESVGTYTISATLSPAGVLGNYAITYNTATFAITYNFAGFFQPVENNKLNKAKAGSAIPLKFSLGGYFGLNIFASGYPKVQVTSCDPSMSVDPIEETVTAGSSSLQYDPTTGWYSYIWKTNKTWTTGCKRLELKFIDDETTYWANFQFTK